MATKITQRLVQTMKPHTTNWDATVAGFNVRRQFSEVRTFNCYYRTIDGTQRFLKIGRWGIFTVEEARQQARHVLLSVALGNKDPSGERQSVRSSMPMAQLCDEYVVEMDAGRNGKKTSTIKTDKGRIQLHIKPKLGQLKVVSVTQEHIEKFMHGMSSSGSAKRTVGLMSAIFAFAVKRKLRETNPCHGIEKPSDVVKLRRLAEKEYEQLYAALPTINQTVADIFTMLAVSGWRSGEARCLKWSEVDLDRRVATLGDTKSGLSVRPLSGAAIAIIKKQERNGDYVFAHSDGTVFTTLNEHWAKLGLDEDVTPHTMRHSFASLAADVGIADHTISGLLGHARQGVTSRYMHLSDRALIEAADIVANETLRLMRI